MIEGLKLIFHNAGGVNIPDDPAMPYKLEATFRPPEFMYFAFIGLFGGAERIAIRNETREALAEFIAMNNLRDHPRLIRLAVTGPVDIAETAADEEQANA